MGSKRKPCILLSPTRLQVLFANKKLTFLLSIVLLTLLYEASIHTTLLSSSSNKKRKGVGGRDATSELSSLLRSKRDGRAAVAIIRVVDEDVKKEVKYLVQIKSHDYPISPFRGAICLLGGNANTDDISPVDTLVRELHEELGALSWVNDITAEKVVDDSDFQRLGKPHYNNTSVELKPGTVRYVGLSRHTQSAALVQKSHPYAFLCALYEITLRPSQLPPTVLYPRGATVQEGRLALLNKYQLMKHAKYSWGYEFTMSTYFGMNATNVCEGVSVEELAEGSFGEWRPEKI
ncbi:hypothetical protein HJC23_010841 [Cyclotella cryptica]|uniref:Nudix hydrolase domain-containing protein n=1 Tax=Cyclotella cryptica TaxID=29204 RepID=A0ABD3QPD2_9STRA|eukprot:CCRYP_003590-RA/>CCRYP_003590-RA protein AED:0.00 eAED:0.00 QI:0/-1/0/1/-1/1/1/0/290